MVGDLNEDEWFYQCPTKTEGSIFKNKKGTCPESLQYRTRAKIRADNDFKLDIIRKDAEQEVLQALTRFHQREIDHYRIEIKKSKRPRISEASNPSKTLTKTARSASAVNNCYSNN